MSKKMVKIQYICINILFNILQIVYILFFLDIYKYIFKYLKEPVNNIELYINVNI